MQPSETFWKVFAGIGIAFVVVIFVTLAYAAFDALRGLVRGLRLQYKYKHRFDRQPTAKCYCKDCKWHSVKDNKCSNVTWADRHTPDNGFCYDAEPMTAKEAARRGKDD